MSSNTTLDLSASSEFGLFGLGSLAMPLDRRQASKYFWAATHWRSGWTTPALRSPARFQAAAAWSSSAVAITLAGVNTYTGSTSIISGTLSLAHPLAMENSTVNVNPSGALIFAAGTVNPTLGGLAGAAMSPWRPPPLSL